MIKYEVAAEVPTLTVFILQLGRRMAEFPVGPMLSKMLLAAEKYVCIIMCIGTILIKFIMHVLQV